MDTLLLLSIAAPLGIYALGVPVPGPNLVVITHASFNDGHRNGAAAAFGTTASVVVYALATVVGVSALIASAPSLLIAIQIVGGLYLAYLGIGLLKHSLASKGNKQPNASAIEAVATDTVASSFLRAFLVGLGNPKMAIFFVGLLAPTLSEGFPLIARIIVLVGIVLIDLIYHQVLAFVIAKSHSHVRVAGQKVNALLGGSMLAFGVFLIGKSLQRA